MTSSPASTPKQPSNLPPVGCVSIWLPVITGGRRLSRPARRPKILPTRSTLTVRPAALLGLDQTLGSLEPNKSANLLIFTGDPLDPASHLSRVLIEGRTVYEN